MKSGVWSLKSGFERVPKWVFVLAVIVLAVVAIVGFTNGVGKSIEAVKQWRFDRRVAARERQIEQLTIERDAAIKRAEAAERQADIEAAKSDAIAQAIDQRGGRIEKEEKKINEAFKSYEREQAVTGADTDPAVRCRRLCAKRAELGYPCAHPCE